VREAARLNEVLELVEAEALPLIATLLIINALLIKEETPEVKASDKRGTLFNY
jgi:hypothetical protein